MQLISRIQMPLNLDAKKIAAFIGILFGYFYLLLTGGNVSAERAFIMSSLLFCSIILDLRVDPMRSLAIALTFILLHSPESAFSPSLQMSVAACISLICSFGFFKALIGKIKKITELNRSILYIIGILLATAAAGIGTAPFIAYHFHNFSLYSMLANLVSVPLSDFIIMPLGLAGLLLMPLHLERIALIPMDFAIRGLLLIAEYISELPAASIFVPSFSDLSFAFIIIGSLSFLLCNTSLRYIGILPFCIGLSLAAISKLPDLLVSSQMFAIRQPNGVLAFSSRSQNLYMRKVWQQFMGAKSCITLSKSNKVCNPKFCKLASDDFQITIVQDRALLESKCSKSVDLFINLSELDYVCVDAKMTINKVELESLGILAIRLGAGRTVLQSTLG